MIRQIVGRCHCLDSNKKVIKYVISRLKHKWATWYSLTREERKKMLREIISTHENNRKVYTSVVAGRF